MTAYNDNQVIEDLILDITISLEEGDKASATLSACQSAVKKSLDRARDILEEYDDKELARKYAKQIFKYIDLQQTTHPKTHYPRLQPMHNPWV